MVVRRKRSWQETYLATREGCILLRVASNPANHNRFDPEVLMDVA